VESGGEVKAVERRRMRSERQGTDAHRRLRRAREEEEAEDAEEGYRRCRR